MHTLVIGRQGQLALSLNECAERRAMTMVRVGRPDFDITRHDDVARIIDTVRPDVVINCAAYTAVDKAEQEPEAAHAINALGAAAVGVATARAGLPLIHLSTDYVFDGAKTSPYDETDPVAPLGVYGRTKREGEERVSAANPRHLIVRTAWVISPFGRNFAKTMLALSAQRNELSVVDDQIGTPTYAPHLADALLSIADKITTSNRGDVPWGIYHLAGSGEATWFDLAREIFAQAKRHGRSSIEVKAIPTSEYPTPARRPPNSRLCCRKMTEHFAQSMPHWRDGVRECVERLVHP